MIDDKMNTDDNSNATELNRNFNLIEDRHTFRDGDGIGVGDSNELSNKFSKVGWYVEKTDNPEIFKVIERWERKAEISNL